MFTAFIALQNISSKVVKDLGFKNLGFVCIAVIYLVFTVSASFAPRIVKKLGDRTTLILSSLCYVFYAVSFIFPVYRFELEADGQDVSSFIYSDAFITTTLIAFAALTGLGAGPLWVGATNFIAECATEELKGFYNSLFLGIF